MKSLKDFLNPCPFIHSLEEMEVITPFTQVCKKTTSEPPPTLTTKDDITTYYVGNRKKLFNAIKTFHSSSVIYITAITYTTGDFNKIRLLGVGDGTFTYVFDMFMLKDKIKLLLKLLQSKQIVGHNLQPLFKSLASISTELSPNMFDTYICAQIIEYEALPLTLCKLVRKHLGIDIAERSQVGASISMKHIHMVLDELEVLKPLSEKLINLSNQYAMSIKRIESMEKIPDLLGNLNPCVQLEMKFLPELIKIELAGILINLNYLQNLKKTLDEEIEVLVLFFKSLEINPRSPEQVQVKLKELGINVDSTAYDELNKYSDNPMVLNLLRFRHKDKLLSSIKSYLKTNNGRLYTTFNQLGTITGRISSTSPSVHQIPQIIKSHFYKATEGKVIIKADYPTIELRIAAIAYNDEQMIDAFIKGVDIHKKTASLVLNKPIDEISEEERRQAKAINFGFIYGMGAKTFKEYAYSTYGIELTEKQASAFKYKFNNFYRGTYNYQQKMKEDLEQAILSNITLKTTTIHGRRIQIDKLTNALNYPIQGTGADMLKQAVVEFAQQVKQANINVSIINLIHDEIVIEADLKDKNLASVILIEAMESVCNSMLKKFKTTVEAIIVS